VEVSDWYVDLLDTLLIVITIHCMVLSPVLTVYTTYCNTHLVVLLCCPTSVLGYWLAVAYVHLPGFLNCLHTIVTSTLDKQCAHWNSCLELPLVTDNSLTSPTILSGALPIITVDLELCLTTDSCCLVSLACIAPGWTKWKILLYSIVLFTETYPSNGCCILTIGLRD
jgi:hypothetical protein